MVRKPTAAMVPQPTRGADGARVPEHETVYRRLRALILHGEIAPGQAVTIQGLAADLGAGMTPVREAIRRLIAESALVFQGNRRVSVPVLGPDNLDELILLRRVLDTELARRAVGRARPADIDRLEAIDMALDGAIARGDVRGYLAENHRFHAVIYELADAPILAGLAEGLWLRFGPSLRVVCGRLGTQNLPDRHKEAIAAWRRGDADAVAAAMERDVVQGMEVIRAVLTGRDRSAEAG